MQWSVGVDIVEFKKAKAFYAAHRKRLGSFLSPSEKKFVENKHRPYEALAMVFAAKEAAFKALGESWIGPDKFRRIRIQPTSENSFSFLTSNGRKLQVTLKKSRSHVVACCAPVR